MYFMNESEDIMGTFSSTFEAFLPLFSSDLIYVILVIRRVYILVFLRRFNESWTTSNLLNTLVTSFY